MSEDRAAAVPLTPPPGAARSERSQLLDCIRAVAIVMVVFFHVSVQHSQSAAEMTTFEWFFRRWGSKGVDVFFPLSGYLITLFLLSDGRADYVRVFFLRRIFRIVPLYFVAVTVTLVGMYVLGYQTHLIDRAWINYTFLSAWFIHFEGQNSVPYTISWSLSVEEFAYVLFGLVAWISRRSLPAFLTLASLLAIALKLHLTANDQGFYFLPLARLDSIAIGGLTAWLMLRGHRPLLWLGLALTVCAAVHILGGPAMVALTYTEIALVVSILIVIFQTWARDLRMPVTGAIAAVGFYSYFTYLFHLLVIRALFTAAPELIRDLPFSLVAGLVLALTHAAAVLSYRWFEGPLMRYGRRLEARPPDAAASVSGASRRSGR